MAALTALAAASTATADEKRTSLTVSGVETEGAMRAAASVTQRIGRKLALTISRSPSDHAAARVTNYAGHYVYPNVTYDDFNNAHLSYPVGVTLLSAGYTQRVRECCPSSHTSNAAPDTYSFWYVQGDWQLGPVSRLGPRYGLSLQDAQIAHSTNPAFPDPNYAPHSGHFIASGGPKNKLTYVATVTLPFDRGAHIGGFISATNSWDYFQSSPTMYLYNEINYGVVSTLAPNISYSMTLQNVEGHHQSYPYASPNTINRHTLVTQLTYRVHL